jgi:hypothetical protein
MTPLRLDLTNEKELAGAQLRHPLGLCPRNNECVHREKLDKFFANDGYLHHF